LNNPRIVFSTTNELHDYSRQHTIDPGYSSLKIRKWREDIPAQRSWAGFYSKEYQAPGSVYVPVQSLFKN